MITSEVKELKVLQCDLNDSLSLAFCQQSLFPYFVSRDLHQHGGHYSQKTKELLRELVFLSRLEQEIRLSSVVSVYGKLRDVFSKVKAGRSTEAYWMKLDESEELLECVNREIFCVLDEQTSEKQDENGSSSLNALNESKEETKTENDSTLFNDSKDSKDSKGTNDLKDSKGSNDLKDSKPFTDSKDSKKKEGWLQPPEKWVEVRRILSELNEAGSPSAPKCVLLSVLNMKVLTELHNFLLSPAFYCLLSLRRILNRAFDEKTLSSREGKLLAEVRRRLEGQLDPTWRANWLTFQRITEIESERNNAIDLPRRFPSPSLVLTSSDLSKPPRRSLLRSERRLLSKPLCSLETQHRDRSRRQFSSNSPSRSKRFPRVSFFFSFLITKRRDPYCSTSISSATRAWSSRTTSQSSKWSPTDSKSSSKSAIT